MAESIPCLLSRYEVKFQNGQDCGGAYIKLLSHQDRLDLVNSCYAVDFMYLIVYLTQGQSSTGKIRINYK